MPALPELSICNEADHILPRTYGNYTGLAVNLSYAQIDKMLLNGKIQNMHRQYSPVLPNDFGIMRYQISIGLDF